MNQPLVLIIEDDPAVLTLTRDLLLKELFEVRTAATYRAGQESIRDLKPDLIVLDLNLPDGDGLGLCRELKSSPDTRHIPVFMLTARGSTDDIVAGLEAGAEDYLPKPFNEREFLARSRSILRRKIPSPSLERDDLVSGTIRLSPHSHEAWCKGRALELTLREFDILQVFLLNGGRALTRDEIVKLAWGPTTAIVPRVVDVHVGHLRAKLGGEGRRIETVPQVGYKLTPTPEKD
jgi:two-component system alkaline phosphatase synthesis response regulator PhoP